MAQAPKPNAVSLPTAAERLPENPLKVSIARPITGS
jgi:hypothetical protein